MSTPRVKIDIRHDLIEIIRNQLIMIGYDKPSIARIEANSSNKEFALLCAYYKAQRRIVSTIPRVIHKASTFSVPTEHAAALNTIEQRIRNGESIVPYLHRTIKCLDYDDLLLNDWGIHHLHLGTKTCSDGFVDRTGPLLYVCFGDTIDVYSSTENTKSYFIGILDHQSFIAQILIEIIYDNWPDILRPFQLNGVGVDGRLSDADIKKLRNGGVNYFLETKDGNLLSPPGGGITTARTGNIDTMRAIRSLKWADNQQKHAIEAMSDIIERSKDNPTRHRFGRIIDLRLESRGENTFVLRDTNSGYTLRLLPS